jgi:hypothetical protein
MGKCKYNDDSDSEFSPCWANSFTTIAKGPYLMYHIAFRVPMLVLPISEDFNKLLQNGSLATTTFRGELCRIMIMAINLAVVLIIRILWSKYRRTNTARKVLDMILAVQRSNI